MDDGRYESLAGEHAHDIRDRLIGVCPQKDLIFEELTGREHIEMYCTLKGVPIHEGLTIMEDCELGPHLDKKVRRSNWSPNDPFVDPS